MKKPAPVKTIWKFELHITDRFTVEMPRGADILSVQMQGQTPCLWALVDPMADRIRRAFRFYGTGHPCDSTMGAYVGTIQISDGALIFHLFEA